MSTSHYSEVDALSLNDYQQLARLTAGPHDNQLEALTNWSMGLCGESGEFIDHIKKVRNHGHQLDRQHIVKELGDILWYLALASEALGVGLQEVATENIKKLKNRYPHGFDRMRSVNREEGNE